MLHEVKMFAKSLISTRLYYCESRFFNADDKHLNQLQRVGD